MNDDNVNDVVKSGGAYDIIKARLTEQGNELKNKVDTLNENRIKEFGGAKNEILTSVKIRTKNNCVPIDMAQINGQLLVGYQASFGIKSNPDVSDMFYLYDLKNDDGDLKLIETEFKNNFLSDPTFVHEFNEFMTYYSGNKLIQVSRESTFLYIAFQISSSYKDRKVFKFEIKEDEVVYIGGNADEEFKITDEPSFEWISTGREDHVLGDKPHVSIKDKVFVETIGGDLTIKNENNTDGGEILYTEPVKDQKQVLEDADISYCEINSLILLNIKPYNEDSRYFIYNTITETIIKADSIEKACEELPEDHGVIFPDGYCLTNGEHKIFKNESDNLTFFTMFKSPNGEDYMYVFFDPIEKCYVLYSYNLINKRVDNPIHAHGYSVYENGNVAIFRHSDNDTASKIHPLTVWKTPFYSDEFFLDIEKVRNLEVRDRFLLNIGNSELVRAVSDLYDVINFSKKEEVTTSLYEGIIRSSNLSIDNYHWLKDEKVQNIKESLKLFIDTSELIVEEFEKVKSIQKQSIKVLEETTAKHKKLISRIKLVSPTKSTEYVVLLGDINKHIGHLISIKTQRYIDVDAIEAMREKVSVEKEGINDKLLELLQNKKSFNEYFSSIEKVEAKMENVTKVVEIEPLEKEIEFVNSNVSTINNEINDIEAKDSTITSQILDHVSEVFAKLNQVSAKIKNLKKSFLSKEAKIEFGAQFKLLSQSVSNSIGRSTTPEKCDEEFSLLSAQVEKLESKFSDFDEYMQEIYVKRDEISDTFENHKQQLVNAVQKKIGNIVSAAQISLKSVTKKVEKFDDIDELNTYFSSDSVVLKISTLVEKIRTMGGEVQAEDLDNELVKIKDMSMRSLRDNQDIFKKGGTVMIMGKNDFAVNKTPLDLTILNQDDKMVSHLTSTDYYKEIESDQFNELSYLWNSDIPSESDDVYRAEYLSYLVLNDAINSNNNLNIDKLTLSIKEGKLNLIINEYASSRYKDSYIKGVHDYDAEIILKPLIKMYSDAGTMTLSQKARSYAVALKLNSFYNSDENLKTIKNANNLKVLLNNSSAWDKEIKKVSDLVESQYQSLEKHFSTSIVEAYFGILINDKFEVSKDSYTLLKEFKSFLSKKSFTFNLTENYVDNLEDVALWMESLVKSKNLSNLESFIYEASALYLINEKGASSLTVDKKEISLNVSVDGLIGDHKKIEDGSLNIILDEFLSRLKYHDEVFYPSFEAFVKLRQNVSHEEKEKLCLEDFKSKPLTSFVRNKLISEVYLPMIGDNFAKQMGTVGEGKRSDLMGLLLLISPPGYGKTTLIEYVANKLGLVFVKVNCPSIGHSVTSLDPSEASDSTSMKEINKINLAFEMGSNVLLYLDDIQHTNPEFLQKFISLCDGTRRVEGVWEGKTKTYDMRGKRFAIVMAGNPYTETGESFKIPDMLANRADIYNLGDILGGKVDVFKLSYIENSLTSNKVLAPLATRGMEDVYKFIKMAKGENIPIDDLDFTYAPAEANEIINVLKHMVRILEIVFSVNMEYIKSAATNDRYRVEPIFKLQGSYRNMNKMTEKLVSVMNYDEITNLIVDHYTGESQTLTHGAESNMLKLKSLLDIQTDTEKERWEMICEEFNKDRKMGGEDADSGKQIAMQFADFTKEFSEYSNLMKNNKSLDKKDFNFEKMDLLVDKIKENQSEDKLIELFAKRIEAMEKNFIRIIGEKDENFIQCFKPMNIYFDEAVKKNNEKKKAQENKNKNIKKE